MICRFLKVFSGGLPFAALSWGFTLTIFPIAAWCQAPGYPPAQPVPGYQQTVPAQPAQPPAPGPPVQQQMQGEYAFRGDLTNQQYGECLGLERTWQANWYRYAAEYQRAMMVGTKDPIYPQVTWYVQGLKQQLDQSWNTFSSKCLYFPPRQ
jgi:hypothetical protein